MVTLEYKAKILAAQLRQLVGFQRRYILPINEVSTAGRFIQAAEHIHQRRFT
ncbi:hypothetical protein D046_8839, partial [Vibrio parahaemolyticus V-223/04]